jgi:hypothetical protein
VNVFTPQAKVVSEILGARPMAGKHRIDPGSLGCLFVENGMQQISNPVAKHARLSV